MIIIVKCQLLHTLTILTPREAAQRLAPPTTYTVGRKEITAAALALERLACSGALFRYEVNGELSYVND